jgi:hypothetical protein
LSTDKSITGIAMNKVIPRYHPIKAQSLLGPGIILTLLSLSVAACVEQLAKLLLLLS